MAFRVSLTLTVSYAVEDTERLRWQIQHNLVGVKANCPDLELSLAKSMLRAL